MGEITKKILYISYDGMTDPLGQSQVLPYLVGLSKKNYKFHILSFEKKERFEKECAVIEKICSENGIEWTPLDFHSSPPILAKIYDRILMKREAIQLHKLHRFDMVHCRSYPSSEVGLYLKRKFGVPFLFDMRGFWPDEKLDSGHWNQKWIWYRKMYRYYKRCETDFILFSDQIISLTQAGKEELVRRHSRNGEQPDEVTKAKALPTLDQKISVIPCCADLDHFDYRDIKEDEREVLRRELGIKKEQQVLSYSGSLGTWYMMDEMLQFFKVFKKKYPDAVFLCLTKEPKQLMDEYVERNGIDASSVITTFSSRAELPVYLSLSYCSIFFIRPTYSKISSSPTKHAELMGLGIPVICNDFGDTGRIIKETGSGILVNKFTSEEFEKVVNGLENFITNIDTSAIRRNAYEYFDLKSGTEKYSQVYRKVFAESVSASSRISN